MADAMVIRFTSKMRKYAADRARERGERQQYRE
jgi:hypothetical protein